MKNYRETRTNSGRIEIEMEEMRDDKGKTSMVTQWGWRLNADMETW